MKKNKQTQKTDKNTLKIINVLIVGLILGFIMGKFDLSIITNSGEKLLNENILKKTDKRISEIKNEERILGDINAPITIVEYSDFECPLCKKFFNESYEQIKKDYVETGKVKYIFKHFPLNSIHPNAQIAALASDCAREQGKFWEMHGKIFESQSEWSKSGKSNDIFIRIGNEIGLNKNEMEKCLNEGKYNELNERDYNEGKERGVNGTPTFFINEEKIVGAQPLNIFQEKIENLLSNI